MVQIQIPNIVRPLLVTGLLVASLAGLSACADDSNDSAAYEYAYQNVLFSGTSQIVAPVMTAGHAQPAVSWPATDEKHVVCALFSERISISDKQITNEDKIVWLWHSGLGNGREGNVLWEHGVTGKNLDQQPKPLAKGTYYWGVWALNEQGLPSWSSQEIPHTVQ